MSCVVVVVVHACVVSRFGETNDKAKEVVAFSTNSI